jgi:hypothetical protein
MAGAGPLPAPVLVVGSRPGQSRECKVEHSMIVGYDGPNVTLVHKCKKAGVNGTFIWTNGTDDYKNPAVIECSNLRAKKKQEKLQEGIRKLELGNGPVLQDEEEDEDNYDEPMRPAEVMEAPRDAAGPEGAQEAF